MGAVALTAGKGGLVCMNCAAIGYGCTHQGCNATATCASCDGCCKAGTCNPNGKTQDNSCGKVTRASVIHVVQANDRVLARAMIEPPDAGCAAETRWRSTS